MSEEKRAITIEDLKRIRTIEDPQISPDGAWIAYVVVTPDAMEEGYKRDLWLVSTAGGDPIQLTRSGKDGGPRWSPDGKTLAFTSRRGGEAPQVYLLRVIAPGGDPRPLTSHARGAFGPAWSPDGTQIAYLSNSTTEERAKEDAEEKPEAPRDSLEAKQRKEREAEDEKKRLDPRPVERIPYREGTSYWDGRYAQIYVIGTEEVSNGDGPKPRRLTNIDASYEAPQWSADGKKLYTARTTTPGGDEPWRSSNLYVIDVASGAETRIVDEAHSAYGPKPSPDGRWVVFGRIPRGSSDHQHRLSVMPANGGEIRDLNRVLDRSITAVDWTPDGRLLVGVASEGDISAQWLDVETGSYTPFVTGRLMVRSLSAGLDGSIAFGGSTPRNPSELYYQRPGEEKAARITHVNEVFLSEVQVQPSHELRFRSPSGVEIQGWYHLPVGYEEGKKYPLAVNIHGGPHVMWSNCETTMWHEWQTHAARGYVVFYCNPRGSDGYGEEFQRALHSAWGDVAYEDIMAGVDEVVKLGFVDEKRMAVTGGSYGGYMTGWIVGHTERFACAVSQRGVYNLISFVGTSDIPTFIKAEFDVEPWEDHQKLWEHSPLAYAHKVKTPTLLIHAENDFRVPIEQGEQFFALVRRSGGTIKMLRFPRDGHEMSRSGEPGHRVARLTAMVDWFDRYCMPQN